MWMVGLDDLQDLFQLNDSMIISTKLTQCKITYQCSQYQIVLIFFFLPKRAAENLEIPVRTRNLQIQHSEWKWYISCSLILTGWIFTVHSKYYFCKHNRCYLKHLPILQLHFHFSLFPFFLFPSLFYFAFEKNNTYLSQKESMFTDFQNRHF